jgi:hypothetical protein
MGADVSLGMGGHSLPNEGETNVWLTPPEIIRALGPFDLDPCAAPEPRPWPTAARHVTLPDDGLAKHWEGRVWLNPPYGGDTVKWMKRLAAHDHGTALIFARTETECWHRAIWPKASAVFFFHGRLFFHRPDGVVADHNAGAPSALIAYGMHDVDAIASSGLRGKLITLSR